MSYVLPGIKGSVAVGSWAGALHEYRKVVVLKTGRETASAWACGEVSEMSLVSAKLELTVQFASPETFVALQLTEFPFPETLRIGVTPTRGAPDPSCRVTETTATSFPLAKIGPLTESTAVGVDTRAFPDKAGKRPGQMRPHPAWVIIKIRVGIHTLNLKIATTSFSNVSGLLRKS